MSFDDFVTIVLAVMFVICSLVLRFGWRFERVTYKDQRVGVRTKWWRR